MCFVFASLTCVDGTSRVFQRFLRISTNDFRANRHVNGWPLQISNEPATNQLISRVLQLVERGLFRSLAPKRSSSRRATGVSRLKNYTRAWRHIQREPSGTIPQDPKLFSFGPRRWSGALRQRILKILIDLLSSSLFRSSLPLRSLVSSGASTAWTLFQRTIICLVWTSLWLQRGFTNFIEECVSMASLEKARHISRIYDGTYCIPNSLVRVRGFANSSNTNRL